MPKQDRDFRAEYARRIERGRLQGLSRSQARGHPTAGQSFIKPREDSPRDFRHLEEGLKAIRGGASLTTAAKEIHVSPERLRRYLAGQGVAEKKSGKWVSLPDQRSRQMLMYSNGQQSSINVDRQGATIVAGYLSQVGRFLETNDPQWIAHFQGASVADTRGRRHPFETDPNTLYRLTATGDRTFEQIYRINAQV